MGGHAVTSANHITYVAENPLGSNTALLQATTLSSKCPGLCRCHSEGKQAEKGLCTSVGFRGFNVQRKKRISNNTTMWNSFRRRSNSIQGPSPSLLTPVFGSCNDPMAHKQKNCQLEPQQPPKANLTKGIIKLTSLTQFHVLCAFAFVGCPRLERNNSL